MALPHVPGTLFPVTGRHRALPADEVVTAWARVGACSCLLCWPDAFDPPGHRDRGSDRRVFPPVLVGRRARCLDACIRRAISAENLPPDSCVRLGSGNPVPDTRVRYGKSR